MWAEESASDGPFPTDRRESSTQDLNGELKAQGKLGKAGRQEQSGPSAS